MTPRARKRASTTVGARILGTEHQHQAFLLQWAEAARGRYPALALLFAIPNFAGRFGNLSARHGARLKAEGRKSGVPDLCLPVARGVYHGFYGELKVGKNQLTAEQTQWLAALTAEGYYACCAHGWDAMRAELIRYLELKAEPGDLDGPISDGLALRNSERHELEDLARQRGIEHVGDTICQVERAVVAAIRTRSGAKP